MGVSGDRYGFFVAGWWSVGIFKAGWVLVGIYFDSVGMGGVRWGFFFCLVGEFFGLGGDQWGSVWVSGGRWGWEHGLVKPKIIVKSR